MEAELQQFKTEIDLRAYAAAQGYQLDRKESWAGSAVMRHPAGGDKIIIKRDADSHWVFFSVKNDAAGSIIDFVQHLHGISLGAARKELRSFMGMPATILAPYPPLLKVAKDRIRVERVYARAETATGHPYLENDRGISLEILTSRRFIGRIRSDRRGNALFGHWDGEGLSGFEIKNQGFTGFSTGGAKALWTSHIEHADNRLVVCESAIDALSFAALFPDAHTRYASLGGKPTPLQKELLRATASVMAESSVIVAAMDADAAGREMAEVVRDAVKLAGRADLRFEIREPQTAKDWNEVLTRSKPRSGFTARSPLLLACSRRKDEQAGPA